MANKTKKEQDHSTRDAIVGSGIIAGMGGYEFLPNNIKFKHKEQKIQPLATNERILILHSDPKFGSGHSAQAAALEKELKSRNFQNITSRPIQDFTPKYHEGVQEELLRSYNERRSNPNTNTLNTHARNYYYAQGKAAAEIAAEIESGKYDRVISLTGDTSEGMRRLNSPLRRVIEKSKVPIHQVFTDRGINAYNAWWNPPVAWDDPSSYVESRYTSVHVPDSASYKAHRAEHPGANIKHLKSGLSVDTTSKASFMDARLPTNDPIEFLVHGGSTGVNVNDVAKQLDKFYDKDLAKGHAVVLYGGSNTEKQEAQTLLKDIEAKNAKRKYKIIGIESVPKPVMNTLMDKATLNMGAGGTTYEELGNMGKPSLFTYTKKHERFSHIQPVMTAEDLLHVKEHLHGDKLLKDIPGTENGIGRLTGSEMINADDYDLFEKRLLNVRDTLEERRAIAQKNKGLFGGGAKELVDQLIKGDSANLRFGRQLAFPVTAGIGTAGSALLTKAVAQKIKGKEPLTTKEKVLAGVAGGLLGGSAFLIPKLIPNLKKVNKQTLAYSTGTIKEDTKMFLDSVFFNKLSPVAKIMRSK